MLMRHWGQNRDWLDAYAGLDVGLVWEGPLRRSERSLAMMLTASAGLVAIALAGMAANRQMLDVAAASSPDS